MFVVKVIIQNAQTSYESVKTFAADRHQRLNVLYYNYFDDLSKLFSDRCLTEFVDTCYACIKLFNGNEVERDKFALNFFSLEQN